MKGIGRGPQGRGRRLAILGMAVVVAALTVGPIQSAGAAGWSPNNPIGGTAGAENWCGASGDPHNVCPAPTVNSFNLELKSWFPLAPWLAGTTGGYADGAAQYRYYSPSSGRDFTIYCARTPWLVWPPYSLWTAVKNVTESLPYSTYWDIYFKCLKGKYRNNITGQVADHPNVEWWVRQKQNPASGAPGSGRDCGYDSGSPPGVQEGCIWIRDPNAPTVDPRGGVDRRVNVYTLGYPTHLGNVDICLPNFTRPCNN